MFTTQYEEQRSEFIENALYYIFSLVQDNSVIFPSIAYSDFEGKNGYFTFDDSYLSTDGGGVSINYMLRVTLQMFRAKFSIAYFMKPDKRFGDLQYLHIFIEDAFWNNLFVYDISNAIEPVCVYNCRSVLSDEQGNLMHLLKEPIGKN